MGFTRQSMAAVQGNMLVAPSPPHPAPLHCRRVQEESWDPVPGSDGGEKRVVLLSPLWVACSTMCNAWQKIAGFLVRKLGKR